MPNLNQQDRAEFMADYRKRKNIPSIYPDLTIWNTTNASAEFEGWQAARRQHGSATESEADAYNHACDVMEQYQAERAKRGVEIGTEGSLCDGIAWLYDRLKTLEGHGSAAQAVASDCRATCDVCFDEVGNEWPCVKDKARARIAAPPVADTAGVKVGTIGHVGGGGTLMRSVEPAIRAALSRLNGEKK